MGDSSQPGHPSRLVAADRDRQIDGYSVRKSERIKADTYFRLHGCRISRVKLEQIWTLVKEGFPPDARFSITTVRKSGQIKSKLEADSIDELLQEIRAAALPGNPDYLDNLQFWVHSGERTINISITSSRDPFEDGASVSVSGDAEWVRGRSIGIRELLSDTRSPFITARGGAWPIATMLGIIAGPVIAPLFGSTNGITLLLVFALAACLGGAGFFVGTLGDRHWGTRLIILPAVRARRIDPVGFAALIVSILGVVATVAAILVAHSDAVHH